MQKLWKSVNIWQSYREYKGGNFIRDTVYFFQGSGNSESVTSLWKQLQTCQNFDVDFSNVGRCRADIQRCWNDLSLDRIPLSWDRLRPSCDSQLVCGNELAPPGVTVLSNKSEVPRYDELHACSSAVISPRWWCRPSHRINCRRSRRSSYRPPVYSHLDTGAMDAEKFTALWRRFDTLLGEQSLHCVHRGPFTRYSSSSSSVLSIRLL